MAYFAHSLLERPVEEWQILSTHLANVARLASERGQKFGCAQLSGLVGQYHDLGKYAPQFQDFIKGRAPSPDHSTAGAQAVMRSGIGDSEHIADQLAAFCIAGHHAGLPDRVEELSNRLKKQIPPLDPVWKQDMHPQAGLFFPATFKDHADRTIANLSFQLALMGRMIFSTLVDADFLDTEEFYAQAAGESVNREWPHLQDILPTLQARYDAEMGKPREKSDLNVLRAEILRGVRANASLSKGIYTLNVPTGGGKTLASLGFALDHAKAHGMERIICAIPFTSIIDQTAAIFQGVLGESVVLEHHSAIEQEWSAGKNGKNDELREGRARSRLAMENWAAPVVVTTNVQLFESLFANRPSRCRKLHALTNAVIILDEAQTIPLPVLKPCVAALDELARNYGATIILCTATQPALAAPRFAGGFYPVPVELAPDPTALHRKLRRVTLDVRKGPVTDAELVSELEGHLQVLVIVNSRKHALALYRAAKDARLDGLVHLSTRQIAVHRREILADIRERLRNGQPCRVIATSLVEAGVDLDFPRVWRAETGLDQVTQAAGRCNREGKRLAADSIVTIFEPAEAKPPNEIKAFADAMHRVAVKHDDLFSPEAITYYFQEVYWKRNLSNGLDKHDVAGAFRISGGELNFAYRTVAEKFRLIESGMEPVIIPVDELAQKALDGLTQGWLKPGAAARMLQTFIVQVPPKARKALMDAGRVSYHDSAQQFAVLTDSKLYTRELGLLWEDEGTISIDDLII